MQTLAQQALGSAITLSNDAYQTVQAIIAEIDRKLSEQINRIIHHDDYQKLEGAWRGLHHLVTNTEVDEMLKIRVMNISKKELHRNMRRFKGVGWDQSPVFKRCTKRSTASSAASPSAAWWATTTSTTARRTWSCSVKWPRWLPRPTAPSSRARRPPSCRWNPGRSWPTRAT